jgi:hypothetical protein
MMFLWIAHLEAQIEFAQSKIQADSSCLLLQNIHICSHFYLKQVDLK